MKTHSLSLTNVHKLAALVLTIALLMWSVGFPTWVRDIGAANLTFISDTLSDSDLGVLADHTIVFTSPTGVAEGETITITFPGEFNISTGTASIDFGDFDFATTADYVTAAACGGGGDQVGISIVAPTITFEVCAGEGGAIPAGGTTTIQIGLNSTAGDEQILNPEEAGSYELVFDGTQTDQGATRVAIIDDVLVTASVATTFTFVINGLPAGVSVNGSPTTTSETSTATELPFDQLDVGISKVLAQNLQVTTNAANGFTVTLNQNQNLLSSTGADIDRFTDDTAVASSTAWVGPAGTLGNENEYGHMGITSEDETLGDSDTTTWFYDDLWAGNFVNNAREVFYHDGPSDGITADQGSTTVGFQAEIMSFQEAATDYTAVITYVATPVF